MQSPYKKLQEEEAEAQPESMDWLLTGVDLEARRMELRGEVNEMMASIIIRGLLKMSAMSNEPIEIYLSTFGGDAYEGFAIYDAIRACECDVNIIASGKIMSAGFLIFLAGDNRIASEHTTFMMHSTYYDSEGTVRNHEVAVNEGRRINNTFLDIAATRTKRNRRWWYRSILNQDKFFNVVEATELGILTVKNKPKLIPVKKVVKKKVNKHGNKINKK